MERYALARYLQRQHQLVRRMAPGQPLSAYVAQHRLLPAALGPMPEPLRYTALPIRSTPEQDVHAHEALPSVEQATRSIQEHKLSERTRQNHTNTPMQEILQDEYPLPSAVVPQSAPVPTRLPSPAEHRLMVSTSDLARTEGNEIRAQAQSMVQSRVEHVWPAPALEAQDTTHPSEVCHVAPQQHERRPEQPSARRARIEEQPSSLPSVYRAQRKQADVEMRSHAETARPMAKAEPKMEVLSQAESEAAALFTSSAPNRLPQEWLALLAQAEKKSQPNHVAQTASYRERETHFTQPASAIPIQRENEAYVMRAHNTLQPESAVEVSPPDGAFQPEKTVEVGPPDSAFQPEKATHLVPPSSVISSVADVEYKIRQVPNNTALPISEQAAWPSLPSALSGRASTTRFVPAQQPENHEQHKERTDESISAFRETSVAEPISMRARHILEPLVGIDPADARIHRGPAAARFAAAQQADAVTVGDDIALAAGYANDEPETLGLLAHELTHVARHHEPRAVPPILTSPATNAQAAHGSMYDEDKGIAMSDEMLATADEEALAEQVERQVTQQAREVAEASTDTASPTSVAQAFSTRSLPTDRPQPSQDEPPRWGNLPAPWEPLPDWLVASSPSSVLAPEMFASLPQMRQPQQTFSEGSGNRSGGQNVTASSGPGSSGSAPGGAGAQRAGRERSHNGSEVLINQQSQLGEQQSEPEPDLDKLARQVYAVLKRKLDVERRRMS